MTDDGIGSRPPAPRAAARLPLRVLSLALRVVAIAYLATLAGLIWWTTAPMVANWQPRVVLTGSMQPSVEPGDVVLIGPAEPGPRTLPPGRVVLVRDEHRSSGSYLHRIARYDAAGRIVTRGDANAEEDNPPVEADRVIGQLRLLVPAIGRPALWAQRHRVVPLLGTVAVTWLALTALAWAPARRSTGGASSVALRLKRTGPKEPIMNDVEVAIVGAGPTGLALAAELRTAGVTCQVLERRTDEPNLTRAFAVHARTLELLDGRGLADALVPQGIPVSQVAPLPGTALDLTTLDTPYPMVLIVPQSGTERLLEERARQLGAVITRGAEVVGLEQDSDGVRLELAGPAGPGALHARYAVGADGAHSALRRLAGIPFAGTQYATHIMLADVQLGRSPEQTLFGATTVEGVTLFVPFGDGWFRAIVWDRTREQVPLSEPVTRDELRDAFRRIAGDDYGLSEPRWSTRFLSERRQAERYRQGRVFLAGDAAHVHSPLGGQGMNTGIQDAMNLGWKLAAAVQGHASEHLLDSYQQERHAVGASVLRLTDGLSRLVLSGSRVGHALRLVTIRALLNLPPAQRALARRLSGIGIRYPHPAGAHPWVGRRLPYTGPDGQAAYHALRAGRFVLLDRSGGAAEAAVTDWADRITMVPLEPAAGFPDLVLLRPDGYIAWAGGRDAAGSGLAGALREWCGPALAASR